jgi:hypothetical protein
MPMGEARTAGLLVLAIGVYALVQLVHRARVSRSHRNVGGAVASMVAAGIVVVLAASAVIAPGIWESAYDGVSGAFFGG